MWVHPSHFVNGTLKKSFFFKEISERVTLIHIQVCVFGLLESGYHALYCSITMHLHYISSLTTGARVSIRLDNLHLSYPFFRWNQIKIPVPYRDLTSAWRLCWHNVVRFFLSFFYAQDIVLYVLKVANNLRIVFHFD